jgi:4'-phosphopantetheinyl transferase
MRGCLKQALGGSKFLGNNALVLATSTQMLFDNETLSSVQLSAVENERAGCFKQDRDRRDFIAAHILARCVVALMAHCRPYDVTIVQRCPDCGGAHGPPRVMGYPDLHVSWSHSKGAIAAAAGWLPVGVDLEKSHEAVYDIEIGNLILNPREQQIIHTLYKYKHERSYRWISDVDLAFLRLWVCKESLIKSGELTLGTLAGCDLSGIGLYEAMDQSTPRFHYLSGKWLMEWIDEGFSVVGAAASCNRPTLIQCRQKKLKKLAALLECK